MNLRTTITATSLALGLFTMGGCTRLPVTAVRSAADTTPPVATVTVTASGSALLSPPQEVSSQSITTTAGLSSSATEPSTVGSTTVAAQPSDQVWESADPSGGPADAGTTTWVEGICTGMGAVLNELVDSKPRLANNASVGTLRQAMVDYYALSTKTVAAAYSDSETFAPPNVANGDAIHQAYQHFLSGLGDIFYQAALDMTDATDLAAVKTVNNGVDEHITALGSDNAALQAMSSGQLADLAKTIPACKAVSDTANGT